MTISEFAIAMYNCDVVKDKVVVLDSKSNYKVVHESRMEFLRYAHEFDSDMEFTSREVLNVEMFGAYIPEADECVGDYLTIITI